MAMTEAKPLAMAMAELQLFVKITLMELLQTFGCSLSMNLQFWFAHAQTHPSVCL